MKASKNVFTEGPAGGNCRRHSSFVEGSHGKVFAEESAESFHGRYRGTFPKDPDGSSQKDRCELSA